MCSNENGHFVFKQLYGWFLRLVLSFRPKELTNYLIYKTKWQHCNGLEKPISLNISLLKITHKRVE